MEEIALSIGQMKYLESIGVNINNASMYWFFDAEFSQLMFFNGRHNDVDDNIMRVPAFILSDILKELKKSPTIYYELNEIGCSLYNRKTRELVKQYRGRDINTAYACLCYCVLNNLITVK